MLQNISQAAKHLQGFVEGGCQNEMLIFCIILLLLVFNTYM